MRIIGGRWAGRDLSSPGGRVRPTTEELRALWLDHLASDIDGARVLDLFAGSGALGLEALSRGAASVDFLENGRAALHALRANVARFRAKDVTRVFEKDAMAFVDGLDDGAYDVAFADPPYTSTLAERIVKRWRTVPFARILGVEHAVDRPMPGRRPSGSAGEGAFTVYRVSGERVSGEPAPSPPRSARTGRTRPRRGT